MKVGLGLARRVIAFEWNLYVALFRWVFRRPHVPRGAAPFHYIGAIAAILWGFIYVSAVELVAVHFLLPWEKIRLVVDILSLWGLIWMLGFMASLRVYPHLVSDAGLRIRRGISTDLTVPLDAIASISVRERVRDKSRAIQVDRGEQGAVLNVVIANRTNVDVALSRPLDLAGHTDVTTLRCYTDDPRGLVARARSGTGRDTVNAGYPGAAFAATMNARIRDRGEAHGPAGDRRRSAENGDAVAQGGP